MNPVSGNEESRVPLTDTRDSSDQITQHVNEPNPSGATKKTVRSAKGIGFSELPEDVKALYVDLSVAGHPIWAEANEAHPEKWNELDTTENDKRLSRHRFGPGSLVGAIMAPGAFAVFDVDHHGDEPTKWGDVDALVESLDAAGVTVAARVATPGAGHHLYVPASTEYVADIGMGGLRDFPGIEFKGKGNLYLPGSQRAKHDFADYRVEFSNLAEVFVDDLAAEVSRDALTGWLNDQAGAATVERAPDMDAPRPEHPLEIEQVRRQVEKAVTEEVARVREAEENTRDLTLAGRVFKLGRYAYLEDIQDGAIISSDHVRELMQEACEHNGLINPKDSKAITPDQFESKFDRQWAAGAAKAQRAVPFTPVGAEFAAVTGLEDRDVAKAILPELENRVVRIDREWRVYERGVWHLASESLVLGIIMDAMGTWGASVRSLFTSKKDRDKLDGLRSDLRGRRVMSQISTLVQREVSEFDAHPDLLCVGNGVVDLRTGQLQDWDPALLLTASTETPYIPGAAHADWSKALESLPPPDRDWFQGRIGQGITGHTPDDDRVVFLKNNGSGAKSTLLAALQRALGEHMVMVPEKVLTAGVDEHTTEMTELRGVRLAYIEELPRGRTLNAKRLKDAAGTPAMTGRRIARDTIRWKSTHSLFVATNYDLHISETDRGTWRRLAMLLFPFTYVDSEAERVDKDTQKVKDPRLRDDLIAGADGRAEAVLEWAVEGARNWYAAEKVMAPLTESVRKATKEWRDGEDVIQAFFEEFLKFDPNARVSMKELYSVYKLWQRSNEKFPLSSESFRKDFEAHELIAPRGITLKRDKTQASVTHYPNNGAFALELDGANSPYVMRGISWRTDADD